MEWDTIVNQQPTQKNKFHLHIMTFFKGKHNWIVAITLQA